MSAMAAGDGPVSHDVIAEIGASGRALVVLTAMSAMASRLAYKLADRTGHEAQAWLDAVALGLLDQAQATAAELDDEGGE